MISCMLTLNNRELFQIGPECEYNMLIASHNIISYLLCESKIEVEELVFLDFRPFFLSPQKKVYEFLIPLQCCICMNEKFKECIVQQHNSKHPPLCNDCYSKLSNCPFCRISLKKKNTFVNVISSNLLRMSVFD